MHYLLDVLLQADGTVYNRSWIIALILLLAAAGSYFAWHRRRRK